MTAGEVRLEDLLGRVVRNGHGRAIGRIEELVVEPRGEDYLATEFLLGPLEWWRRLQAFIAELPTVRTLGLDNKRRLRPIPWQWIDLTDPMRPVLGRAGRAGRAGRTGRTGKTGRAGKTGSLE